MNQDRRIDFPKTLLMLTREDVAYLLKATPEMVSVWNGLGILHGIKTGRNIMFSQTEVERFQNDYQGYDLSSYEKSKKAYESLIFEKEENL